MQMYVAEIETTARGLGDEAIADALAKLAEWHVVMHQADSGAEAITLILPAESLEQATSAALALVGRAGFTGAVVTVMSEELRDKRQGWEPIPALLGVTEAAATLGVTRQRVLQMISSGSLPATRVGNGWAIQAAAVSGKL